MSKLPPPASFRFLTAAEFDKLPAPKPVTRLFKSTREVGLIDRGRCDYKVDLDRIPDAAALLGWLLHLAEKTWITPRHLAELIAHVERENHISINRGA